MQLINRLSKNIFLSLLRFPKQRVLVTSNPFLTTPIIQSLSGIGRVGKATFATLKESSGEDNDHDLLVEEVKPEDWKVDYRQAINLYPFHYIPVGLVRHPNSFQIEDRTKLELIAFKTLTLEGEDLDKATHLLLSPQQIVALNNENPKFRQLHVFQYFFQDRLSQLASQVNNGAGPFQERLKAMKILSLLSGTFVEKIKLALLNESKVVKQDPTGVLAAYYIRYAINNRIDYVHILPLLSEQMKSGSAEVKLNIARSIIGAHNFQKHYPKKLIDEAVQIYQGQLGQLHNYEILFFMRFTYQYQSLESKVFAKAVMNHIIAKHVKEGNIDYHVPMILKSIKFITKQGLSCDPLIDFIKSNLERFKIIFEKKKISTGFFLSLIYSNIKTDTASEQTLSYLKEFFFKEIDSIVNQQQIEDGEVLRVSKLLIKYSKELTPGEKEYIKQKYLSYIIPHFGHHQEILFYSLLVVLRDPLVEPTAIGELPKFERNVEFIKKNILSYIQSSSIVSNGKKVISRNINSIVELYYQIHRHRLTIPKESLADILGYDFKQKDTVKPEVCGFFFTYLSHNQHSQASLKKMFEQFQPTLEVYLRKKQLPLSTLYGILNVCEIAGYENQFLFKHIQNNFAYRLMSNPNLFVDEKDIRFIERKMVNKGYGSVNLRTFIKKVLDNPKNWQKARFQYVEREKAFQERLAIKRQERQSR